MTIDDEGGGGQEKKTHSAMIHSGNKRVKVKLFYSQSQDLVIYKQ